MPFAKKPRNRRLVLLATAVPILVIVGGVFAYKYKAELVPYGAIAVNSVRYLNAPAASLTTEVNPALAASAASPAATAAVQIKAQDDWPSYNKTLTSDRFSPLAQINRSNVGKLKVLCTYDTHEHAGFSSGLIMVEGALIGTTEHDTFSIDPATCRENWRTREAYTPAQLLPVNRGAAYMDGRLFRGTNDGRVLAYDFKTGRRLWSTTIADASKGEQVDASPAAWNGLVFAGNAGGDNKGVKGRMYALDAATGRIVWEFYLVPRTAGDPTRGPQGKSPLDGTTWRNPPDSPITGGATWTHYTIDPATGLLYVPGANPAPDFAEALRGGENLYSNSVVVLDAKTGDYQRHFKLIPIDWHDWDVASAPALIKTAAGRQVLVETPKDGHLYGIDLGTGAMLYRKAVTRIENADTPFTVGKPVRFCPGTVGGSEWNGPAYDPATNLVYTGEVDWCTTVRLATVQETESTPFWQVWMGEKRTPNPYETFGKMDPFGQFAGWLYASDADSGAWKWRAKNRYPILSGVTPTAGGLVFFGDMGGNVYALDTDNGQKLWGKALGGAIGGGVITYTVNGAQKVAVTTGYTNYVWPTKLTTAKIAILGLA